MEIILTSILTFVSTNIDDIFILILFFANQKIGNNTIVSGQLLGVLTLAAISLGASEVGMLVGKKYIGWLGFIPIYFGVRAAWSLFKNHTNEHNRITSIRQPTSETNYWRWLVLPSPMVATILVCTPRCSPALVGLAN
ncbi:MAG: cadmium resistance transporter [Cytophagales bacterium]